MIFLPDSNACITLLRQRDQRLIARWKSVRPSDIVLCSITVYELRYGAQRSSDPGREHAKLDLFFSPFNSLPFDDQCASFPVCDGGTSSLAVFLPVGSPRWVGRLRRRWGWRCLIRTKYSRSYSIQEGSAMWIGGGVLAV